MYKMMRTQSGSRRGAKEPQTLTPGVLTGREVHLKWGNEEKGQSKMTRNLLGN